MIIYMVSKLALNPTHFTRGLIKYVNGRGHFAVPSQNGDKLAISPTPPIVERLERRVKYWQGDGACDLYCAASECRISYILY